MKNAHVEVEESIKNVAENSSVDSYVFKRCDIITPFYFH